MRIGEIVNPFRRPAAVDIQPSSSEFSQIRNIALSSGNIWFDRKDSKVKRYEEAASQLLFHLTDEVLSDPKFYQELDSRAHMGVLRLLGTFVPKSSGEENDKFMSGKTSKIIVSYLRGIVSNRVTMKTETMQGLKVVADGKRDDYKERIAQHLYIFSGLPRHYLDEIYPGVGLAMPERLQVSMPTVVPRRDS